MHLLSWRRSVALLVVVVVVAIGWWGWTAWQVQRDLTAARDDVEELRAALSARDAVGARRSLEELQDHATSADARTDGPTWAVLKPLPFVGDDASGVATVSSVLHDLSTTGMAQLIDVSEDLDGLTPQAGRVNLDAIAELVAPVQAGRDAFREADARLAAEDPTGYVGRLRTSYDELADQVSGISDSLDAASTAVEVMPAMLGSSGSRNYLLVFQNNAEVRTAGGVPGAATVLTADDGRIELGESVPQQYLGEAEQPVLPLTPAERKLYGPALGTFFADANWVPDFDRSAALWEARWEQVFPDQPVDGVLAIDPVALSYVMQASGPVSVDGIELSSENVVDELLHNVYLRLPTPEEQDAFFGAATAAIFDSLTDGGVDPQALLESLGRAVDERRLYVKSFVPEDDEIIGDEAIGGPWDREQPGSPSVGVYVNDVTGAKMSYFLRYDAQVVSTSCVDDVQRYNGKLSMSSVAPTDAATLPDYVTGGGEYGTAPGSQLTLVSVYGPRGGTISDFRLRNRPQEVEVVEDDGRQVVRIAVQLDPNFSIPLTWRMQAAPGDTGDTVVDVTPGIEPRKYPKRAGTSC